MSKIIATRGLPGSGKSTWAKAWVAEDPANRTRVCRDDLRYMSFGAYSGLTSAQEDAISGMEQALVRTAIAGGKEVVVDAMHLRARYAKKWYSFADEVEFKDFEIDYKTLMQRGFERSAQHSQKFVPEHVLQTMYNNLTVKGELRPAPERPEVLSAPQVQLYVPDKKKPRAFIVDIDGTIARLSDDNPRSHYDYTRVIEDEPNWDVMNVIHALSQEHMIILMSGRDSVCRQSTEQWLWQFGFEYEALFMRAEGDDRRDDVVKLELFNENVRDNYNVKGAFDDRDRVVKLWRSLGIRTYQVDYGDF